MPLAITYPTLLDENGDVLVPHVESYDEGWVYKPTSTSMKESGIVKRRKRFTTDPLLARKFMYRYLSNTNKGMLQVFERDTVGFGTMPFNFTDWITGTVYPVCFDGDIEYEHEEDLTHTWRVIVAVDQIISGGPSL